MTYITPDLLRRLSPALTPAAAAEYAPALDKAAREGGLSTRAQVAAFIAQLAHESAGFRFLYEIWGPTDAQKRYDPTHPNPIKGLGNVTAGDGYRYRGRGFIQLTGRHNYRLYGRLLRLPMEDNPDLAASPEVAARVAVAYWMTRRYTSRTTGRKWSLNELADAGDYRAITRAINGGENGLMDRYEKLDAALAALAPDPTPTARAVMVDAGAGTFEPLTSRREYPGPVAAVVINPEKPEAVYIRLERR